MNPLAETPAARCGSHADGRPGANRLPNASAQEQKQPQMQPVHPAPCRPDQPTAPQKLRCADIPAGPPRWPQPAPKGGGAHVPGRASPRLHASAPRTRAGLRSAALGDGAQWSLSAPAAHRAPSSSSPGPSLRAHTHLTSALIKARGAAPDGSPRLSTARFRCRRSARTALPRAAHSFLSLQRMLQAGVGRGGGEGNRRSRQDPQPNSGAALAPSQPLADLTAVTASAH